MRPVCVGTDAEEKLRKHIMRGCHKKQNKPADLWSFEKTSCKSRKSWCAAILLSYNTNPSLGVKLWGLDIYACVGGGSHKVTGLYHNLKGSACWQAERSGSDEDRGSLTWSDFMIRRHFPTFLGVYGASINHSSVSRCQGGTGHFCMHALKRGGYYFRFADQAAGAQLIFRV